MLISLLLLTSTTQSVPVGDLLIRNVHVASPDQERALMDRDVWIEDGVIVRIVPSSKSPLPDAEPTVLDGGGRFLAPGLVDAHVHLPSLGGELPPENIERVLALHLLHGVTTLKVLRGKPEHLPLRKRIDDGEIVGPRLYVSAPPLSRRAPLQLADAPARFVEWSEAGYDFVKFLSGVTEEDYVAFVAAAHDAGLTWTGHGPPGGLGAALASGQMGIEHATPFTSEAGLDPEAFAEVCAGLGKRGVFVCPDLLFYERLGTRLKRDEVRCLELAPAEQVAAWDEECRLPDPRRPGYAKTVDTFIEELPRMHAAGIRLLISPGSGPYIVPGAGYAEEVALLARSGLSPRDLLGAATSNAAASLGVESIAGRVVAGHRADLVLLDRDPLKDATAFEHVSATVLAGRVANHEALRSTIDRALEALGR